MKLSIQQTLGIVNAEIDLEPGRIVEVVGPNASGKTSLAVCAQAVLARDSNPLGLSAAESKRSTTRTTARKMLWCRCTTARTLRRIGTPIAVPSLEWGIRRCATRPPLA